MAEPKAKERKSIRNAMARWNPPSQEIVGAVRRHKIDLSAEDTVRRPRRTSAA
ncbi:MAG: hypothetical protein M3O64_06615 [Chloroflexota bacterium]|nr:hypothetical protein [Chloroflexota bacterium]